MLLLLVHLFLFGCHDVVTCFSPYALSSKSAATAARFKAMRQQNYNHEEDVQHILMTGPGGTKIGGVTSISISISTTNRISNNTGRSISSGGGGSRIYIGTKRGKLFQIDQEVLLHHQQLLKRNKKQQQQENESVSANNSLVLLLLLDEEVLYECTSIENRCSEQQTIVLKPYPIYSMDSISCCSLQKDNRNNNQMILCGGGDRFVTIWEEVDEELVEMNNGGKQSCCEMKTKNYHNDFENDEQQYNRNNPQCSSTSNKKNWSINSRLGPHTGWVKDVIYDHTNDLIYSIGCNCIEIWSNNKYNQYEPKRRDVQSTWGHVHKLTIDSCKEQGSTLSSDLLCLSTYHIEQGTILFAGGVDGRIHSWNIHRSKRMTDSKNEDSIKTLDFKPSINPMNNIVAAHDGRVNQIIVCQKFNNTLFSIGHDGAIIGFNIEITKTVSEKGVKESIQLNNRNVVYATTSKDGMLELCSAVDNTSTVPNLRLLATCLIYEDTERAILAVGTSSGHVFLVETNRRNPTVDSKNIDIDNDCDCLNILLLNDFVLSLRGNPTVHCLSCVNVTNNHKKTLECNERGISNKKKTVCAKLAIGHSDGVTFWDVNITSRKD